MRKTATAALSALTLAASAAAQTPPAPASGPIHFAADTVHSAVAFRVRHLGVSWVNGRFSTFSATFDFDSVNVDRSSVTARIATASFNTENARRDTDIKTNYIHVDSFPEMTFVSRRVERAGPNQLRITGDLTLHGVTKSVVLDTEFNGMRAMMRRRAPDQPPVVSRLASFTATTVINRRDFGITFGPMMDGVIIVGDDVRITIDIEARAAPTTAP